MELLILVLLMNVTFYFKLLHDFYSTLPNHFLSDRMIFVLYLETTVFPTIKHPRKKHASPSKTSEKVKTILISTENDSSGTRSNPQYIITEIIKRQMPNRGLRLLNFWIIFTFILCFQTFINIYFSVSQFQ